MKILVLTSRYTASRDIIDEDFGRQVRLFEQLAKLGHKIDFFCADYKRFENRNVKLHGINILVRPFKVASFFSFLSNLNELVKNNRYGIIIATSDPLWGVVGYFLSKKHKKMLVYDVQDNYVTYKSYSIPLLGFFDRLVEKNADLVMCASNALAKKVMKTRRKKTIVIPNGVDMGIFRPLSREISRKRLKLPDAKIIAYIGSVQKIQGVDILMDVFEEIGKEIKNAKLLIVGRIGTSRKENFDFERKDVIYLGSLPQKDVVYAINASDVLVLPYPRNLFTEFMLAPYKLVEFMACNKPVVITDVGEMRQHIKDKNMVAKAGDVFDLKEKIKYALTLKKVNSREAAMEFEWKSIAKRLDKAIRELG